MQWSELTLSIFKSVVCDQIGAISATEDDWQEEMMYMLQLRD
jgi:hypothetical protein